MNFPNVKQLKKLADACRKAGIKHFKSSEFEFSLTDELPESPKARKQAAFQKQEEIANSGLSEEELLFWSTPDFPDEIETAS